MSQSYTQVQNMVINDDAAGQRLDNFLCARFRNLPKSRIYQMVRKGEVRVNGGRIKAQYRLMIGDQVRIPPLRLAPTGESSSNRSLPTALAISLRQSILFEDDQFLALNKPAGLAVHGGSGIQWGLIEALRQLRPEISFLELVHRLDRDTSGCLLVAKNRSTLLAFHQALRQRHAIDKDYLAIIIGAWPRQSEIIEAKLQKRVLASGERIVRVDDSGQAAKTCIQSLRRKRKFSLIQARPITGRTHQIRVHCQYAGHSIAGDQKYSAPWMTALAEQAGIDRLCLHAHRIRIHLPGIKTEINAPLDDKFAAILDKLDLVPTDLPHID